MHFVFPTLAHNFPTAEERTTGNNGIRISRGWNGGATVQELSNKKRHSVWLATGFEVEAPTAHEATEVARAWLSAALYQREQMAHSAPLGGGDLNISRPAVNLADAVVLALQLIALERRSGEAAARIAQLRAELEEEKGMSALPLP